MSLVVSDYRKQRGSMPMFITKSQKTNVGESLDLEFWFHLPQIQV